MKAMTYRDLTPELLQELSACTTAEEIVSFCAGEGLVISPAAAADLLDKLNRARELGKEEVAKVAGGQEGYAGTRKQGVRADSCDSDTECFWDLCWQYHCDFYDCYDNNGNGIDDRWEILS